MTIQEQIKLGEPIFSRIDELLNIGRTQEALDIIETTDPLKEWIIELDSKSKPGTKYKTLPLSLQEAIMRRIFQYVKIFEIKPPLINQDKNGKFSSTIVVTLEYYYKMMGKDYLHGVATISCNDISQLELATPKASSMAVKNAIKQMGGLLGKYLNISEVEEDIPISNVEKPITPEERINSLSESIAFCKTLEELKSFRLVVYSKATPLEIHTLYETKLREFKKNKV